MISFFCSTKTIKPDPKENVRIPRLYGSSGVQVGIFTAETVTVVGVSICCVSKIVETPPGH